MSDFYTTKLALSDAAQSALLCHFMSGATKEFHAERLCENVVQALSGCEAGTTLEDCRAKLLEVITDAITDSHDLDSTDLDAAESVLRALLDNIAPLPAKQKVAA